MNVRHQSERKGTVDEAKESPEAMFQRTLRMEEAMANALVAADITMLEELADVPISELLAIEGLEEPAVQIFRQRAREYLLIDASGGEQLPPGSWED